MRTNFCWFIHEAVAAVVRDDERNRHAGGRGNVQRTAVAKHMNRAMDDFFRFEAPPAPKGALR